jgi:GT2 family glycosyltransferase
MPKISIIILACNKAEYTRLALRGLRESTFPDVETILVDNGSSDNTPEVFAEHAAAAEAKGWTTKLISFPENIGAIAGRNRALTEATGDYIVFMDNDVVIGVRSFLEKLVRRFEEQPDVGIIGPKILFAAPPHLIQCAGCEVCRGGRVNFLGRGKPGDTPEFNRLREVQCLISACWIMKREVRDKVGELDMLFHPVQFEDIDYCYRAREAGYRVLYDPSVFVYHFENVTTDGTPSLNYTYLTVKNGVKFKQKWLQVFAKENGPEDASIVWENIPGISLAEVGELKIHD